MGFFVARFVACLSKYRTILQSAMYVIIILAYMEGGLSDNPPHKKIYFFFEFKRPTIHYLLNLYEYCTVPRPLPTFSTNFFAFHLQFGVGYESNAIDQMLVKFMVFLK